MLYKRRLVEPACRVLESMGPTNTRVYRVAVYFKGKRLADSEGPSIQQAEMRAAEAALKKCEGTYMYECMHTIIIECAYLTPLFLIMT